MVPEENSMEDPLCNSSFGSMVSLDYVTPDTDSEIPEWLQEFRENLVDDEIPLQGDSHASSSHEASLEPTTKRREDLGKHNDVLRVLHLCVPATFEEHDPQKYTWTCHRTGTHHRNDYIAVPLGVGS